MPRLQRRSRLFNSRHPAAVRPGQHQHRRWHALIQPRFGFNYTFDSERPTQLRGGVGLFQGAAPNVWLAGTYQNTGLNYIEYTVNNPGPIFTAERSTRRSTRPPAAGARQNVDIAEPDLKLPSVWKANLAFDHELPWYGVVARRSCC